MEFAQSEYTHGEICTRPRAHTVEYTHGQVYTWLSVHRIKCKRSGVYVHTRWTIHPVKCTYGNYMYGGDVHIEEQTHGEMYACSNIHIDEHTHLRILRSTVHVLIHEEEQSLKSEKFETRGLYVSSSRMVHNKSSRQERFHIWVIHPENYTSARLGWYTLGLVGIVPLEGCTISLSRKGLFRVSYCSLVVHLVGRVLSMFGRMAPHGIDRLPGLCNKLRDMLLSLYQA